MTTHRPITLRDLAVTLARAGRTIEESARALECEPGRVRNYLIAAGLKPYTDADLEADRAAGEGRGR